MTRFAIVTDTHIRPPGGDLSSPFPVNLKANSRAEYAIGMLAAAEPEFTIHLGDVIHPLPHMPSAAAAANEAKRILAPLLGNMHFVPGNHDIGDKPSDLMPAGPADAASIARYQAAIGPQYHEFRHGDLHIVCMNSSLVNSGLPQEAEQREWLAATLEASDAAVKILFSHYPPFVLSADEPSHYDNYAEPGRSWLLQLAAENGIQAIVSGHVHHFFYNRWKGVELYCLPATSFTRQDYAELFPVEPASEYGRDDTGKYAVAVVDVVDGRMSLCVHNTGGREGPYTGPPPTPPKKVGLIPHLRHAWHIPKVLPYNGPMEEFGRKVARNDYPLLRLLQLGIQSIRVPASDLLEPAARSRIEDWRALSGRIVPFLTGKPSAELLAACKQLRSSIEAVEVVLADPDQAEIAEWDDIPIWLAKITTSADNPDVGKVFAHAVGAGAFPHQFAELATAANLAGAAGAVMQVPFEADLASAVQTGLAAIANTELYLVINLSLRCANPAVANFDAATIEARIGRAMTIAHGNPAIRLQIDTFEDVDRGYGPRFGLIDRRSNLRITDI